MKEYIIRMTSTPWRRPVRRRTIVVAFRPRPHYLADIDPTMKAYDVVARNGRVLGRIERATESTDRHYGRIRVPGKGRPAWAWARYKTGEAPRYNYPGCYESNRAMAVARMLGYEQGEEVT